MNSDKGIRLSGFQSEVVSLSDSTYSTDDLIIHDQFTEDPTLAHFLSRMTEDEELPLPIGIFRSIQRPCYEDVLAQQIDTQKEKKGEGNLESLLNAGDTWVVN